MVNKHCEITVVEAENLPVGDSNGLSDPYVTVDFNPGNVRLLKTSVKPETLNPVWNETYEVPIDIDAENAEFIISVKDKDIIGVDHLCYLVVPLRQLLRTGELDNWYPLTKKLRSYADIGYGRLHLQFRLRDYHPPASRSNSLASQGGQSQTPAARTGSISQGAGAAASGDAEKRFLYHQEHQRGSITEQLDSNSIG